MSASFRSLLCLALTLPCVALAEGGIRRFSLVVGSNDGGPSRTPLRYASSDATAFARVLARLGGLAESDSTVLAAPNREGLLSAFQTLSTKVATARGAHSRTELLVYYSGHSDETGLLLGAERFEYPELRRAIDSVGADVRIAILDSCGSGAILRSKGGRQVPAFLVDDSSVVRGHAFLTASAEDEAAQESDRLRGSFFTHALLTGLRGAADTTGDGKVTLNEAYQFAFQETLSRTERTQAGPQHPAYDIQLAGSGDLVLTDLRATGAGLVLARELDGRLYLRDLQGVLVAELKKSPGHLLELGLEPGEYAVTLETASGLFGAKVALVEGKRAVLESTALSRVSGEVATTRKGPEKKLRHVPVGFSLFPSVALDGGPDTLHNFSFNLIAGAAARLEGFELGVGASIETGDVTGAQVAAGANVVGGTVRGFQTAAGANVVHGEVYGAQVGALGNYARQWVYGTQISGVMNFAGQELYGLQLSGVGNWARTLHGAQIGVVNATGGGGGQLGVVNVSMDKTYAQVGVVNVAKSVPAPIGVINVAEDSDAPIGLINVVKNGYWRMALFGSDLFPLNAAVKLGGRYTYTLWGVAGRRGPEGPTLGLLGALGVHLPFGRFFVDPEVMTTGYFPDWNFQHSTTLASVRVQVGYEPFRHFALVAGPTFNAAIGWNGEDLDLALLPQSVYRSDGGNTTVRLFPGFMLGVQL